MENYPIVVLRVGRLGVAQEPVEGRRRVEGKRNNGGVRRGESECHARLRKNMEYVVYSRCTNVQKERLKKDKVDVSSQTLPNTYQETK